MGSEYKAKEATGIASETMTLLSSMATALVVKSLVTACKPMTLDMTLGAAGAGIYLVGELANLIKYRESSKDQINYAQNGNLTDAQIDAFKENKKNYEEAKKATKIKLSLMYAAAAAYTAAGVSAGLQWAAIQSATTALIAAQNVLADKLAAGIVADEATCSGTLSTKGDSCLAAKAGHEFLVSVYAHISFLKSLTAVFLSPNKSAAQSAIIHRAVEKESVQEGIVAAKGSSLASTAVGAALTAGLAVVKPAATTWASTVIPSVS